ncbi:MAG: hypothetical protein HUU20_03905 [Pirellulales bacterium]|nr:hypothetical protein [Pirellulales bacterium]
MVLASLLVVSLLGLALVQAVVVHQRQMRLSGQEQQCFWLAEAGVGRAVQRLAVSDDYRGEQWNVPADVFGRAGTGVVVIEVSQAADSSRARRVRVEARFPDDPVRRTVCRREFEISWDPISGKNE